ncbi:MAG TPA: hypothetical protein VJW94_08195 [Candidatus Acidoferrum sp.]|nr:hypothetical protein [Candidatus Acidoferrum sp.]
MIPGRSALLRCFCYFTAMAAAFLFFVNPAFAQDSQECYSLDAEAFAMQDKPADQPASQNNSQEQNSPNQKEAKNGRMFYVMPNYLTVANQAHVPPINWKEKFAITAKGAFDPYEFTIVGALAGIRQAENAYPAFGQGMSGYGKRYGAALADQVDGNIMVGAVFPTFLKTDPRYFQMGKGGFVRRFGYAISRIFVTRRDSGGSLFNFPEFVGNAAAITISNVYYPAADRGFTSGLNNWGVQMGIDAFGNELKEFWPDIHHWFSKKKSSSPPQ